MQFELPWRRAGRRGQATEGSGGVANAETGHGWPRLLEYSCNHCYTEARGKTILMSHIEKKSVPIMKQVTLGVENETGYRWLQLFV